MPERIAIILWFVIFLVMKNNISIALHVLVNGDCKLVTPFMLYMWQEEKSLFMLFRMLEEHNMELVLKQDFHELFYTRQQFVEDVDLLYRMQALDRQTVRTHYTIYIALCLP